MMTLVEVVTQASMKDVIVLEESTLNDVKEAKYILYLNMDCDVDRVKDLHEPITVELIIVEV